MQFYQVRHTDEMYQYVDPYSGFIVFLIQSNCTLNQKNLSYIKKTNTTFLGQIWSLLIPQFPFSC